jgi:predicted protein tyrosine phosphatase
MRFVRKYWVGIVLLIGVLAALWGRTYLDRQLAEAEPGYAEVETGLYIGRHLPEPPKGAKAVLCLSMAKDHYMADAYSWQPIPDGGPAPSLEWLKRQVDFVAQQRKAGRQVYIHCDAGVSRSGMVTTAYLMWEHKWGRDKALAFLRERRPVVKPNRFFMTLLLEWEGTMKDQIKPADASVATTQPAQVSEKTPAGRSEP